MRLLARPWLTASFLAAALAAAGPRPCLAGDQFAAIAYSPSRHTYAYSYGYCTRAAAERAAVRYCKAADAGSVVWTRNQWCALALDLDGDARGWGWDATAGARARAFAECQKRCDLCYVAVCVSAGGQVTEYDAPLSRLASLPKAKKLPKLPAAFFPAKLP
jgi:hypothetical protein